MNPAAPDQKSYIPNPNIEIRKKLEITKRLTRFGFNIQFVSSSFLFKIQARKHEFNKYCVKRYTNTQVKGGGCTGKRSLTDQLIAGCEGDF